MKCFYEERQSTRTCGWAAMFVVAGMALLPGLAEAQSWRIEPLLRVGAEFDDNARLDTRTDEEVELEGWLAEVSANFVYATERTNLEITPRYLVRRYPDNPEFDSEDVFFRAAHRYEGQTNNFGIRATFDEQQVRNAERSDADLDSEDPEEIPEDSTGRVAAGGQRAKWRVTPYWERRISASSFFGADFEYFSVDYSDVVLDRLRDYTDARLNLNYRRSISPKSSALVTGSYRRFDRDDNLDNEIDGYNAMVGLVHALSPTTTLRAVVGFEFADQGILGSNTEPVADISLRRRLETVRFLALYRRVITASGTGQLAIRDSIMLNATRRLSEKISAGVGLRAYQSENLSDLTREDREYVQLRSRFIWNFTRTLSVTADYRYTILDRGNLNGETANSNQVNLWLAYEPRPRDR